MLGGGGGGGAWWRGSWLPKDTTFTCLVRCHHQFSALYYQVIQLHKLRLRNCKRLISKRSFLIFFIEKSAFLKFLFLNISAVPRHMTGVVRYLSKPRGCEQTCNVSNTSRGPLSARVANNIAYLFGLFGARPLYYAP